MYIGHRVREEHGFGITRVTPWDISRMKWITMFYRHSWEYIGFCPRWKYQIENTDISRDSLTDWLILYFYAGYVCRLQHFDKDNSHYNCGHTTMTIIDGYKIYSSTVVGWTSIINDFKIRCSKWWGGGGSAKFWSRRTLWCTLIYSWES
jgi:hypothetical protein